MVSELLIVIASLVTSNAGAPPGGPLAKADVAKSVQQEVGDISGYYSCKGMEAGGKSYSGVAVVVKKNDVYIVQWMVGGGSSFSGIAIRQGDTLAASWAMPNDRGIIRGVNVYRIESGPRLVGRWSAFPGDGTIRSETLTFLKKIGED